MKLFNLKGVLSIVLLSWNCAQAQISSFPYTETFDRDFQFGFNIDFIPNWLGNEVSDVERIYKTTNNELGMIATGSFSPEVQVKLNFTGYTNPTVTFKVRTEKNQDGNRFSLLYVESSFDGGLTWNTRQLIGTFANEDTPFSEYKYVIAGAAGGKANAIVRFSILRGDGVGTSAKVIMDDVSFYMENADTTPPEVADVIISSSKSIRVKYNDRMGSSATIVSNYSGLPNLTGVTLSPDKTTAILQFSSDFGIGKELLLTIQNVYDVAGNKINAPYAQKIIYNNTKPDIVITELMYHSPAEENDSLEFLEIYNKGSEVALMGGLYFSDGIVMTFPEYDLNPGEYLLIAGNALAAHDFFGQNFLQWESGSLNNAGENLEIKNALDQVITSVKYERTWGGDGNGHSISFCSTVSDPNLGEYWISTPTSTGKTVDGKEIYASPNKGCENTIIPEIRFVNYSAYTFEGATFVRMQLVKVYPNASSSQVKISIDNSSTATLGADYASSISFPSVLNFPVNTNLQEIELQILDDQIKEGVENIRFVLSDPVNATIGGLGYFDVSILDNDAAISQVCVNELSASNNSESGIKDNFGNPDDWIELKNGSNEAITLAGYFVSDNPDNLTKYQLPIDAVDSLTIPANGYLILWADNQTDQGFNHLNFALSAAGEYFALVMPDGKNIVDDVTYPALAVNTSYGRSKDCDPEWIHFETPTFMSSNKPTSIIYRENNKPIVFYPNPNTGNWLFASEPIDYLLFDSMGRMLQQEKSAQQIDISHLPSGWYIIQTQGYATKFIVNR